MLAPQPSPPFRELDFLFSQYFSLLLKPSLFTTFLSSSCGPQNAPNNEHRLMSKPERRSTWQTSLVVNLVRVIRLISNELQPIKRPLFFFPEAEQYGLSLDFEAPKEVQHLLCALCQIFHKLATWITLPAFSEVAVSEVPFCDSFGQILSLKLLFFERRILLHF